MKYLIPVLVGGAAITATVTTAIAQAHGAFNGHASLTPYLYAYGMSFILLVIAALLALKATKQEKLGDPSRVHKEVKDKLAALMRLETEIRGRMVSAPNHAEFIKAASESDQWASQIVVLLKEIEPTDAERFSQVINMPAVAEQVNEWRHIPDETRRNKLIRLAMYRQTLDQIISNRRL